MNDKRKHTENGLFGAITIITIIIIKYIIMIIFNEEICLVTFWHFENSTNAL